MKTTRVMQRSEVTPLLGQTVRSTNVDVWEQGKVTHEYGDYVVIDSRWEVHRRNVTPINTQGEEHVG